MAALKKQKLLAIDPALNCSGWALFSVYSGKLLGVGKIRSLPADITLAKRLADLQERITKMFEQVELSKNDILVCEAATTMRDPRAAMILEQIRGMYETLARTRSAIVPGRISPRSVQYEILGLRGSQISRVKVKDVAVHAAQRLFTEDLNKLGFETTLSNLKKNQDIADALLIGSLALNRIQSAQQAGIEIEIPFEERRRQTKVGLRRMIKK